MHDISEIEAFDRLLQGFAENVMQPQYSQNLRFLGAQTIFLLTVFFVVEFGNVCIIFTASAGCATMF